MTARGFFITGTDTEIGKTLVSTLLIRALAAGGNKVVGMKPVASGASESDGQLQNEDALALMACSNVTAPYEQINPYCFVPPVAPHIAAAQAGIVIEMNTITGNYSALAQRADVVVVEGVGGWRVPLGQSFAVSDLARALDLPVIMVVGIRLGCINHALLTTESIQATGCKLAGWVANIIDGESLMLTENIETLRSRFNFPLLATIPYISSQQDIDLSNVFNIKLLDSQQ
jgi:dethiobiotin synthetase